MPSLITTQMIRVSPSPLKFTRIGGNPASTATAGITRDFMTLDTSKPVMEELTI